MLAFDLEAPQQAPWAPNQNFKHSDNTLGDEFLNFFFENNHLPVALYVPDRFSNETSLN